MPGPLPSCAGLHCGHSPCRLETKAWPSQTIVAQNGGKATHAGQSGMAATHGNGNVNLDRNLLLDVAP